MMEDSSTRVRKLGSTFTRIPGRLEVVLPPGSGGVMPNLVSSESVMFQDKSISS